MSRPDAPSPLLRTQPIQARAQRTVDLLLATASEILAEGGPEALTTSRLAERSGLRVRNVYRYFPNRTAIFAALSERLSQRIEGAVTRLASRLATEDDGSSPMARLGTELLEVGASEPGLAQIRAAMRSTPELQAMELESDRRIARILAEALASRNGRIEREELELRAFVLVTALGAIMDRWIVSHRDEQPALLRELLRFGAHGLEDLTR